MKLKAKLKLCSILEEEKGRIRAVMRTIHEGDIEASYRILTTAHNEIGKVRLKLFSGLHPSLKKTVPRP